MGVNTGLQGQFRAGSHGVSVLRNAVDGAAWTFVYAPGAGSNLRTRSGSSSRSG